MKMKSKITNSYDRVPKNDSATEKVKDLASPLALSRPNEKYGATAIATAAAAADAATSDARPVKVGFDLVIIYLSVLLSDMTRGILFPTVSYINCWLQIEICCSQSCSSPNLLYAITLA